MALFGFNYGKPGPGVSKDEPEKKALFRFFGIYFGKFWDLLKMNMLYFVSIIIPCIPMIICLTLLFRNSSKDAAAEFSNLYNLLVLLLCALPIALTGPFTAAFTFLLRNCVRHEHYFLWSDYKDTVKNNFKQSLLATLINVVITYILVFNIRFYYINSGKNQYLLIPFVLCMFISIIFLFMNYYLYLMIITFDLKLKQIYKNAAIFAVMGFGRNLLVSILLLLLIVLHTILPNLALLLIPFLSLSFAGLIINFAVWPVIKKYMIDTNAPESSEQEENEEEILFKDKGKE